VALFIYLLQLWTEIVRNWIIKWEIIRWPKKYKYNYYPFMGQHHPPHSNMGLDDISGNYDTFLQHFYYLFYYKLGDEY